MKKLTLALLLGTISLTAWADDTDDTCDFTLPVGYQFADTFDPCDSDSELAPIIPIVNVGYANKSGQVIITPKFTEAHPFSEGVGLVKHDGKYGYVNDKGEFVIKPTYEDAWSFSEGRAKIEHAGKYGFIDKAGKVKVPLEYDSISDFSEGFALVAKQTGVDEGGDEVYKYGFVNQSGKVAIALQYDYATSFEDGVATVIQDDKVYTINKKGQIVEQESE